MCTRRVIYAGMAEEKLDHLKHHVQKLWDFMTLESLERSAELLLVLGSMDDRVASYAAGLTGRFSYDLVVFSGGLAHTGDLLRTTWSETEAEHFYDIFKKSGGRAKNVLLETKAENTGHNALFTHKLLEDNDITIPHTIQIVTKPYMLRRARATFEAQWPTKGTKFFMAGPMTDFDGYLDRKQSFDLVVNIMVGDFERLLEYPKKGLSTGQAVPSEVMESWHELVKRGYNKHLIKQ